MAQDAFAEAYVSPDGQSDQEGLERGEVLRLQVGAAGVPEARDARSTLRERLGTRDQHAGGMTFLIYQPRLQGRFTSPARNKVGLNTFQEMSMTPLGFLVASTIANIVFVWLVYPKDEK